MGADSKIEWCHHTFNHVRGCTKVSAGCANCYAETLSHRNPGTLGVWGPNGTRVVAAEAAWKEPLKWDRAAAKAGERHRVFCASLADVFEDWQGPMVDAKGEILFSTGGDPYWQPAATVNLRAYPGFDADDDLFRTKMNDVRQRLFDLIRHTPHLDWLLLTKRPENVPRMVSPGWLLNWPRNVWLGTSVEDQQAADERIPQLLKVPAAVRFLSCEPLLGPLDLNRWLYSSYDRAAMDSQLISPLPGTEAAARWTVKVNWVILGGESGPGSRPMNVEWVEDVLADCNQSGTACFVKQLGARPFDPREADRHGDAHPDGPAADPSCRLSLSDRKGGDWEEWAESLRVREMPFHLGDE